MMTKDEQDILFFAFRYALGRKTYTVNIVVEAILNHWDELDFFFQRKVKEEIQDYEAVHGNLGMQCDKEQWHRILYR